MPSAPIVGGLLLAPAALAAVASLRPRPPPRSAFGTFALYFSSNQQGKRGAFGKRRQGNAKQEGGSIISRDANPEATDGTAKPTPEPTPDPTPQPDTSADTSTTPNTGADPSTTPSTSADTSTTPNTTANTSARTNTSADPSTTPNTSARTNTSADTSPTPSYPSAKMPLIGIEPNPGPSSNDDDWASEDIEEADEECVAYDGDDIAAYDSHESHEDVADEDSDDDEQAPKARKPPQVVILHLTSFFGCQKPLSSKEDRCIGRLLQEWERLTTALWRPRHGHKENPHGSFVRSSFLVCDALRWLLLNRARHQMWTPALVRASISGWEARRWDPELANEVHIALVHAQDSCDRVGCEVRLHLVAPILAEEVCGRVTEYPCCTAPAETAQNHTLGERVGDSKKKTQPDQISQPVLSTEKRPRGVRRTKATNTSDTTPRPVMTGGKSSRAD